MATQNSLLGKPIWSILAIAVLVGSSALIGSYFIKSTSFFSLPHYVCDRALDTTSCLAHVSEVVQGPIMMIATKDNKFNVLQSFLMKFTSHIRSAMDTANAKRLKINNPREVAALEDCVELMDLSIDRVLDSMMALRKQTTHSMQDAHTWLSSVLTNHATCFDGLEGPARPLMEAKLQDLISRARTSLAILVTVLPPPIIDVTLLSGDFPSWVTSIDRKLLESSASDIKADVVVAADGSGNFTTLAEAVASAPDVKSGQRKTRYVIHVKQGTYKENVEIGKKKYVMLIGDGMDITTITGDLNYVDGTGTFRTATVAAVGDGFIAQDIGFKNSAGPEKHQAVALRVGADMSVINRCRIEAFQDTLYPHSNRQFYSDSYITGTIDFIFGDAAAVFQKCKIAARRPMTNQKNMVTAQGRTDPNQNTGYSIQQCDVIPSSDLIPVMDSFQTFLGRPWKNFSRTVVMQSLVDKHIDPAGWAEWDDKTKDYLETLYYGEYMNYGEGAGTSQRVNWTGYHVITSAEDASKFTVKQFIQGDVWLKDTGVNFIEGL